ncbi:winged helix-turn-helix domain-containing protein [Enterococcus caccae]|uniref:OmpR/PhoB-type domain-containing protein n=1 Tax=Enterococcus caccae ATCC BAA-1240 TaxID=1158612 RepID=R3WQ29_9ENTE|nr:helix-turn-helix domain-containing protein [Enterococcus caccae]EOL49936.1 hypothetical protein UC7_00601 [Enterococcus caccae ATCC BAA-1240]EOT56276.1 hypothetical protein I580_03076 [Enterococcus caccae ATCC BAA-1240]OJG26544.1 hypothetical protein RU98_GL000600 [Enterococcus caccae]
MCAIGILSTSNSTKKPYLNALKKLNFDPQFLQLENFEYKIEHLNILMIDEIDSSDSVGSYETILKVRSRFDGYLLLLTKNKIKTIDLVYLQLGVDGIVREDVDYEVTFIQLRRLLDVIQLKVDSKKVIHETVKLNLKNNSFIKNGDEEIQLTNTEYQILNTLMVNKGSTVPYDELYQEVWGQDKKADEMRQYLIANSIFKIRTKIGKNSFGQSYIKTIRTKGYAFVTKP